MKLKLKESYNKNNPAGTELEILDIKRKDNYSSGFAVKVVPNGTKYPVWVTIDWFI